MNDVAKPIPNRPGWLYLTCKHCGEPIGEYKPFAGSYHSYGNYNICDECGDEICADCSKDTEDGVYCQDCRRKDCLRDEGGI